MSKKIISIRIVGFFVGLFISLLGGLFGFFNYMVFTLFMVSSFLLLVLFVMLEVCKKLIDRAWMNKGGTMLKKEDILQFIDNYNKDLDAQQCRYDEDINFVVGKQVVLDALKEFLNRPERTR